MSINVKKTRDMWISFTDAITEPPHFKIGEEFIERVNVFKLLGVPFQNNLKWNAHIEDITRKANKRLYNLRECRKSHLPSVLLPTNLKYDRFLSTLHLTGQDS